MLQWSALVLAAATSVLLAFLPVYSGVTSGSNGSMVETSATLVQVNGLWAIVVLAAPIAIALLPLFTRGRAWQPLSVAASVLLGIAVFLGGFSIGLFFVPALIVEFIAACLPTGAASRKSHSASALLT